MRPLRSCFGQSFTFTRCINHLELTFEGFSNHLMKIGNTADDEHLASLFHFIHLYLLPKSDADPLGLLFCLKFRSGPTPAPLDATQTPQSWTSRFLGSG